MAQAECTAQNHAGQKRASRLAVPASIISARREYSRQNRAIAGVTSFRRMNCSRHKPKTGTAHEGTKLRFSIVPSVASDLCCRTLKNRHRLVPTFRSSRLSLREHPFSRASESHGHQQTYGSGTAYRSEVPERTRRLWCRDFRSAVLARKWRASHALESGR